MEGEPMPDALRDRLLIKWENFVTTAGFVEGAGIRRNRRDQRKIRLS